MLSKSKITAYLRLMRFDKPIGIYLLLWPTLWGLWIATNGHPQIKTSVIFVLGVVVMRAMGCVINDIADRNFDGHVARTKTRPLANGDLRVREAIILFIFLCFIALVLVLQLNKLTVYLAGIGLALAIFYPLMKRLISIPQCVLGIAFSWSIPMVFASTQNQVPPLGWFLFSIAMIWPVIYDTVYAMADREDDLKIGVKSTAILFGRFDRGMVATLQIIFLSLFLVLAKFLKLNMEFYFFWLIAAGLFSYQLYLIKDREPMGCFQAFLNNHWVGCSLFVGIVLGYRI